MQLRRSESGIRALQARYWAREIYEKGEKMGTTNGSGMSAVVEFTPNVPERLAIKFAEPKMVQGRSGPRAMYSLVDGRVMFHDLAVAEQIAAAGVRTQEEFWMRMTKRGGARTWEVWLDREAASPPQPAAPSPQPPAAALPATKLEWELRASLEAQELKRKLAEALATIAQAEKRAAHPQQETAARGTSAAPDFGQAPRFASAQDSTRYNGAGEAWQHVTNKMAKELVAIYIDVRAWSREEHGTDVTDETLRCLTTSAFIETRRASR
jgi:hypothetical protein